MRFGESFSLPKVTFAKASEQDCPVATGSGLCLSYLVFLVIREIKKEGGHKDPLKENWRQPVTVPSSGGVSLRLLDDTQGLSHT